MASGIICQRPLWLFLFWLNPKKKQKKSRQSPIPPGVFASPRLPRSNSAYPDEPFGRVPFTFGLFAWYVGISYDSFFG